MSARGDPAPIDPDRGDSWAHWRSLRYFALARVVVASVLLAYAPALLGNREPSMAFEGPRFLVLTGAYLLLAGVFLPLSRPGRVPLQTMAGIQIAVDLVALSLLIDAGGGLRSGLAVLLILPNAGAAILMPARRGLLFAAISALMLITMNGLHWFRGEVDDAAVAQAGVMGAALMAIVIVVNWLAVRLDTQQRLADQRGAELRRQLAITQAVISELPDGVVVFSAQGDPRAINRSARLMLSGLAGPEASLPGLPLLRAALGTRDRGSGVQDGVEFFVPGISAGSGRRIRARRLKIDNRVGEGHADQVVMLEDLNRLEQRAQQLKLASMGRLSASIAHEIRNPLSAIRHANGLLGEGLESPQQQRFSNIIEGNCMRIDRIIEDVLSISRRGAGSPQALEVRPFIASVIQDVVAQAGAQAHRIETRIECEDTIWFDEGNLRQVLVNLLGNALRHASEQPGAVSLQWLVSDGAPVMLVCEDGPGVPEAHRTQLFEPFFTTESRGTGLGLYLARELCSANGASLRYRPRGDNPLMRSAFIIEPQAVVGT